MKPSERIIEIAIELMNDPRYKGKGMTTDRVMDIRVEAMTRYMDEEYEKQCKHEFVYMTEGDGVGDALKTVERCRYCGDKRK